MSDDRDFAKLPYLEPTVILMSPVCDKQIKNPMNHKFKLKPCPSH